MLPLLEIQVYSFKFLIIKKSLHKGSAAIYGIRGKKNVECFVLYPEGRISEIQEKQMITVLDQNVHVIGLYLSFYFIIYLSTLSSIFLLYHLSFYSIIYLSTLSSIFLLYHLSFYSIIIYLNLFSF